MKTTKKIFAAVLAVMMIALMIPFSASAATTLTVSCNPNAGTIGGDKADYVGTYEYKFFKLATVDTTTGTVTVEDAYASNAQRCPCGRSQLNRNRQEPEHHQNL
jgi:Cna protein B-type domain protein